MAADSINSSCVDCVSNQTETSGTCYPWVAEELYGRNYTLDDVNGVVMRRNIPGIVFLVLCILIGTLGNLHVLIVFSKRTYASNINKVQLRIHVNYRIFILWLSTLGIIECTVVAPLLIVYLVFPVTYPTDALCKTFRFVLYFIPVAMNLTYISIAVDRYLVICRTFKNKLTEKHSLFMCLATGILSVILTWPVPILFGRGKTPTGISGLSGFRCYTGDGNSEFIIKLQNLYQGILLMFFFVVMLILLILYTKVRASYKQLLSFRRSSRRYSTSTPATFRQSQAKQEKQQLWIYGSVTIGYVFSALPYHILAIMFFTGVIDDCSMSLPEAQMFYLFIWSYFISPVLNPLIYGCQDEGFRKSVQTFYQSYRRVSLTTFLSENSTSGSTGETNSENSSVKHDMPSISTTSVITHF